MKMKSIFTFVCMALSCRASVIITVTDHFQCLESGMPSGFALGQEVSQAFTLDDGISPSAIDSGWLFPDSISGFHLTIKDAGFVVANGFGDVFVGSDGVVIFSVYPDTSIFHEGLEFLGAEAAFFVAGNEGSVVDAFSSKQYEYLGFALYFHDPAVGNDTWGARKELIGLDLSFLQVIPEPSTVLLSALAGLGLSRRHRAS